MRKVLVIFAISILFLSGTLAIANYLDELDQSQTVMTENTFLAIGQVPIPENPIYIQIAQSFIPTKDILTRVELYIGKNATTTYPYIVAIRDNLTNDDLTTVSVAAEQVPSEDFGWVEFDFDDISVTTGMTYFIVCYTNNITDNWYAIGANNISDSYPYGCAWISYDDGDSWSNESHETSPYPVTTNNYQGGQPKNGRGGNWDICFKTYGRTNGQPSQADISGPPNGKPGVNYDFILTATDPDEDDIRFYVIWGDGDTEWTSLGASGTPVTVSHSWGTKGSYTITVKAQDEFGLDGPENTLDITIPRTKAVNRPLLRLFENYQFILQFITKILIKFGL